MTGKGNGDPFQCSCRGNPKDRGQTTVPGVARVGHDLVTKPTPPKGAAGEPGTREGNTSQKSSLNLFKSRLLTRDCGLSLWTEALDSGTAVHALLSAVSKLNLPLALSPAYFTICVASSC